MRELPDRLLVVTDRRLARRPLQEVVAAALDGGARWVWLRDRDLEAGERRALAGRLLRLTEAARATLTIGGDARLAAEVGALGVHLPSTALDDGEIASSVMVGLVPTIHVFASGGPGTPSDGGARSSVASQDMDARHKAEHDGEGARAFSSEVGTGSRKENASKQIDRAFSRFGETWRCSRTLVGVSAHGEADIRAAMAAGADYVTLSPIFETSSKPGYGPALGLSAIGRAAEIGLPIIALGGITPDRAAVCIEAGAAGVAVMGEVMRADDPDAVVRGYLASLRVSSSRGEPLSRMGEGQG